MIYPYYFWWMALGRTVESAPPADPIASLITLVSPLVLFTRTRGIEVDEGDPITSWPDQSGNSNNGTPLGDSILYWGSTPQVGLQNIASDYLELTTPITRSGTALELWIVGHRVEGTGLVLLGGEDGGPPGAPTFLVNTTNEIQANDDGGSGDTEPITATGRFMARIRVPNNGSNSTYIGTGQASVNIFAYNSATFTFTRLLSEGTGNLTDSQNRIEFLMVTPAISDAPTSDLIAGYINSELGTSLTLGA